MQLFHEKTIRIIKRNLPNLESKLKVKIIIKHHQISLEGKEEDKYTAEKVLAAMGRNFEINTAFILLEPDYIFEELPIKNFTRKKDLATVRARIIGTKGRTLQLLEELSGCYLTLIDNVVSIIGPSDKIREVTTAVQVLIKGSKQANVYSYLEKYAHQTRPENIGLKINFKKDS